MLNKRARGQRPRVSLLSTKRCHRVGAPGCHEIRSQGPLQTAHYSRREAAGSRLRAPLRRRRLRLLGRRQLRLRLKVLLLRVGRRLHKAPQVVPLLQNRRGRRGSSQAAREERARGAQCSSDARHRRYVAPSCPPPAPSPARPPSRSAPGCGAARPLRAPPSRGRGSASAARHRCHRHTFETEPGRWVGGAAGGGGQTK